MDESLRQDAQQSRSERGGLALLIIGAAMVWFASLVFMLEVYILATAKKYPVGPDPSSNIAIAAFCLLLTLLGGLVFWRGWRLRANLPKNQVDRILNLSTVVAFVFVVLTSALGV